MSTDSLAIGIVGCGTAARIHAQRLARIDGVRLVACADPNQEAAESLAEDIPTWSASTQERPIVFTDHLELLDAVRPAALAIFTPHRAHYRPALDALQAGCHVFVEKPLSTNPQEAVDLTRLAEGRNLKLAVGHQYRLRPSLLEMRRCLANGEIGEPRLLSAMFSSPWLASHQGPEHSWRFDPKISGGGILTDNGDHLLDAVLWVTGQPAVEVAAFQTRLESGLDIVNAISVRLTGGTIATIGMSGTTPAFQFELRVYGDQGWIRATESTMERFGESGPTSSQAFPEPSETIDGNFVAAIRLGSPLCCPAEEALDTVKLQDGVARSAASGQVIRLA